MSLPDSLNCKYHSKKLAQKFCEECKEFLCDSCAIKLKHRNHFPKIKTLNEIIKSKLTGIDSINATSLSKIIELFQFIVNFNSRFNYFDINYITNQINEKIDEQINKLVEIKIQLKTLLAEKIELMSTIMEKTENQIFESQGKIINLLNNEKENFFSEMNTFLEQLRTTKNPNNNMAFIEKYNNLIKQIFDNDEDFNLKYNFYTANIELNNTTKILKENIFDKQFLPFFTESSQKITNLQKQLTTEATKDITELKTKYTNLLQYTPAPKIVQKPKKAKTEKTETKSTPTKTEKNIIDMEFSPPEIEIGQLIESELGDLYKEYLYDDDFEYEFLKLEDGDDGTELATIIDGNDSENATVDLEKSLVDAMDDKLDIQYYEGIKFDEEGGAGLNDEAVVEEEEENKDNKEENKEKEENKNVDIIEQVQAQEKIEDDKNKNKVRPNIEELKKRLSQNFNINQMRPPGFNTNTKNDNIEKISYEKKTGVSNNNVNNNIVEEKNKINNQKNDPKIKELIAQCDQLSWEEKNKLQITALGQGNYTVNIFNILTNQIEEIKSNIKFPLHYSYINLSPYIYISGGKIDGKDSKEVSRLIRTGENTFNKENVAKLNEARTHHCTVYVKYINCMFFISGSRVKSCEKFNLNKNKMESFPALRVSREKCCACVLNERYLYVFFGFDRTKNKFETSIEKIFINNAMSWELITIPGNQNLLKKQNFACIPFDYDRKKGVIITGGVNSLRNETKETVYFDYEKIKAELFSPLPVNSSFTNSYFVSCKGIRDTNDMVNISNEFNVIKFNPDSRTFSLAI